MSQSSTTAEHASFLQHYLACQGDLRAYILSVVRDFNRCEELLQEAALVMWEKWPDYDSTRPFGAWARGIARIMMLREKERSRRRSHVLLDEGALDTIERAFSAEQVPASERLVALQQCVSELPGQAQDLLHLRYDDDQGIETIAQRLRRSTQAVTKQLSRLRAALQRCIERRQNVEAES